MLSGFCRLCRMVPVLALAFFALHARCQTPPVTMDLKKIVPPSPNASALGQYGNTPIGLYTGTPQVNIPLYEINEGSLKLPIGLSYNAGGIKVADMGSWVGLGWALNAGGAITRTVYGIPDEGSANAFYTINTEPTLGEIKKGLLGIYDTQPDIFYFNFNGKTGKFFIGKSNIVCISPHQNLKIQAYQSDDYIIDPPFKNLNVPLQFRITDEDGIVYEFRDYEKNRTLTYDPAEVNDPILGVPGNPLASVTAWYLTKMYSPTGDTIKFLYNDYSLTYDLPSSEQRYILLNSQGYWADVPNTQPERVLNVTRCQGQNKRLKQILFSNGSVKLDANWPRADLVGDTLLNQISVLDRNNNLVKGYRFTYNLYDPENGTSIVPGPFDDNNYSSSVSYVSLTSYRRLMLMNVSELDKNGNNSDKKYSFVYSGGSSFPSRFSKQRDYWGYYNGSGTGEQGFLNYQLNGTDRNNSNNYTLTGMEPNLGYGMQGSLSAIYYPTGGYTEFHYELHKAFDKRGVLPPEVIAQDATMPIDFSSYDSQGYTDTLINGKHCKYKLFTVNAGDGTNLSMSITNMIYQDPQLVMKYDIYTADNQSYQSMREFIANPNTQMTINTTTHLVSYINTGIYFPSGNYKVIFTPISSYIGSTSYHDTYGQVPSFRVSGWSNLVVHTDSILIHRNIGGLRIASTIDYDPVSRKYLQKNYKYTLPGDSISSGTLVCGATYVYDIDQERFSFITVGGDVHPIEALYSFKVLNSESQYPLSTTQGSNVGYSMVTVEESDPVSGTHNGKSEYHYFSPKQYPDYYGLLPGNLYYGYLLNMAQTYSSTPGPANVYPFPPADTRDWERGLITQKADYKYVDGGYVPVRYEDYAYEQPRFIDTVEGLQMRYRRQILPYMPDTIATNQLHMANWQEVYAVKSYGFTIGFRFLSRKKITAVADDGNVLVTTEKYQYLSAPGNMLPTHVSQENSKGEIKTVHVRYPTDYSISGIPSTSEANGIEHLHQLHILSPVVEQVTSISNSDGSNIHTVSGVYNTFKPNQPLPDVVYRLETEKPLTSYTPITINAGSTVMDDHYKPLLTYEAYDVKGNLLQQRKDRDLTHAYIWDYQKSYPIAEAVNAAQGEIAYTSFEANETGGWVVPSSVRVLDNGVTGSRCYNLVNGAIIRSGLTSSIFYIVSYWSNTGSFAVTGSVAMQSGRRIGDWTYFQHKITGVNSINISGSGLIDELRFYPSGSQMTTYTYIPLVGMSSQCDIANRISYYEYDGLQRLKLIRDQDHNILKTYDYQYQASVGCGPNCYVVPMQTFAGGTTLGYPVGVFNVNGKLLGNATDAAGYVSKWNLDPDNALIGTLAAGADPMRFNITLNAGKTLPAGVTGCRYYQVDLEWNQIDGIRNWNAAYVDFGDGTGMHLGPQMSDRSLDLAPNTVQTMTTTPQWDRYAMYSIHTYTDNSLRTITLYHNDGPKSAVHFDNVIRPATSLTKLKNLRGNIPQGMYYFGVSSNTEPTMLSIANITNWSSIHSIEYFLLGSGDGGVNVCRNVSYPQDFMAGNKGLDTIFTGSANSAGYFDAGFKLSKLKADWNTYFTNLRYLSIMDDQWDREDLSALTNLSYVSINARFTNPTNDPTANPLINIPPQTVSNIIKQVWAGAGQYVEKGVLAIYGGGLGRLGDSDNAFNGLLSKGWTIVLDNQTFKQP